jgi:hypothetical protein
VDFWMKLVISAFYYYLTTAYRAVKSFALLSFRYFSQVDPVKPYNLLL